MGFLVVYLTNDRAFLNITRKKHCCKVGIESVLCLSVYAPAPPIQLSECLATWRKTLVERTLEFTTRSGRIIFDALKTIIKTDFLLKTMRGMRFERMNLCRNGS